MKSNGELRITTRASPCSTPARTSPRPIPAGRVHKAEDEGGCGVTGFAASVPVAGRHIFLPSVQMHNRGNGKGGGIAAVGLDAESLGVSQEVLEDDYLIQVAYLDPEARRQVESQFITNVFQVEHARRQIPTVGTGGIFPGLMVKPPDVWHYFVRVKPEVLQHFMQQHKLYEIPLRQVEDEFVAQNCYKLNEAYLRLFGGEKGLCPVPGPQHHDPEDRGLRRGSGATITSSWISRPTSGSPTSATPPGAGSGTPAAPTPSRRSTSPWCTTATSPTTFR